MFKGVGTALVTPFDRDFNVDYQSLKKLINYQIENGVDALVILGTTGEVPVINSEERRKIIAAAMETINGRVQAIIGTGTNDTRKVAEYNKMAEEYNANGLLIVNPYYNKGTQESLVEHYRFLSERTSLPIILYNVPSRTSMNILPETVVRIAEECSNVIAVKEASGNISQIAHLFSIKPSSLKVYSGNDDQTLPIMALGGEGIISVFSNPYPAEMKKITNAVLSNDLAAARELNNKYLGMMNLLFIETSPSPVKFVLHKLGLCENILRLPLTRISKKSEELLEKEMKKYSLTEVGV